MRIHVLQHVPFEDIGSLAADFQQRHFPVTVTHWYRGEKAPALDTFDGLVIMGGPMGVDDEEEYPWLSEEKSFIAAAIAAGKRILGICLGAQLIACAMGARVTRNNHREIGWFPLTKESDAQRSVLADVWPSEVEVFHWHGDTFGLPQGALWLASSRACRHQAFSVEDRIFGFQFHLETTEASAAALVRECANELDDSEFVQSPEQILGNRQGFARINILMSHLIEGIFPR